MTRPARTSLRPGTAAVPLPTEVMLARPIAVFPTGGPPRAYEPKLDGVRALYGAGRLWSRNARELHIGEAVAAARLLGDGVVLDGELVVLTESGCDFPAVCRRLHSPGSPAVIYVVFDLLAADGTDLRARPYRQRRQQLSGLFADADPRRHAGVQLMPATTDVAEAARWYASPLAEGLVLKRLDGRYEAGRRGWEKLRRRHSLTVLAVGVQGSPKGSSRLILGAYAHGRLRLVGATLPLPGDLSGVLSALTVCAAPRALPGWLLGGLPGQDLPPAVYQPVDPLPVDVAADTAVDGRVRLRHCPPLLRPRPDVDPATVTLPLPAA